MSSDQYVSESEKTVLDVRVTESPSTSPMDLTFPATSACSTGAIPPEHRRRTLILCFDGTGDQFDADNSNVVQFVSLLKRDDRREQMVYYQSGIGTYTGDPSPSLWGSFAGKVSKALDEAVAWTLSSHIKSGYRFLMDNYQASDAICIFGFSRGAYTARSLAGMLTKVGLLPPGNDEQIPFAYKMYTKEDETGWKQSRLFKKTFSVDVAIDFLGVWDTVNSVGIFPQRLPFTVSNSSIRYFRHAVALDERRAKFKANLWPHNNMMASRYTEMLAAKRHKHNDKEGSLFQLEREYSETSTQTNVYEVWFAGCHCDIGGGSVKNETRNALARIPLRWMVRECFLTNTGIMFQTEALKAIGLDPETLYPIVKARPESVSIDQIDRKLLESPSVNPHVKLTEEEEDVVDALCPIFDQLSISKSWWILELLPMKQRVQCKDGKWKWKFKSNMGKPRSLPHNDKYPVHIHRTVKIRMEALVNIERAKKQCKKYTPKASPLRSQPIWVD